MKKLLVMVCMLCTLFSVAWAEGEEAAPAASSPAAAVMDGDTPLLTTLPERKTISSLADVMTSGDADKLQKTVSDCIVDYNENKDKLAPEAWAEQFLTKRLENVSSKRIKEIAGEIDNTIKVTAEKKKSLQTAVKNGETKASWLDGQMKKYITMAVEVTNTDNQQVNGRTSGFTIAGKNWKGKALTDGEAEVLRTELAQDKDNGLKAAVAVALVVAADNGNIAIMGQAAPRQLTTIAINAVEEAKTVLKVKKGLMSGKEGADLLTDSATASVVALLSGFDYKQIGFIAGTAAGTAAGGAIDGLTGGISLGTITINGALIGAYLGEKIGSKLGATLNSTLDSKVHAKIINEFEGFLGGTIMTVLNINDVQSALDQIDKQDATKPTAEEVGLVASIWSWTKNITQNGWGAFTGLFDQLLGLIPGLGN